ncbi:MAG: cadmium resistance transporter [Lysobacter sp.]|nr:cadmium resistance transporter [Lysobacter sp.]
MGTLLTEIGIAIVVFASTNVDDLLVIAAFLADPAIRARAVVAGQFLGIAALTAASAVVAWLALAVAGGWIALLGLVPLGLGLRLLVRRRRAAPGGADAAEDELTRDGERRAERRLHSQVLAVAGVTLANGGDNLGVYVPLFAAAIERVALYAAVFLAMTGAWCWLGHCLVSHPVIGARARRHGHAALPFVLVGLGLWILSGAAALPR